jgi:hypothetical protein
VVLADLTFIEDGNPNETGPSGKLINFYKRRLMYKNISALLHLQVRLRLCSHQFYRIDKFIL